MSQLVCGVLPFSHILFQMNHREDELLELADHGHSKGTACWMYVSPLGTLIDTYYCSCLNCRHFDSKNMRVGKNFTIYYKFCLLFVPFRLSIPFSP